MDIDLLSKELTSTKQDPFLENLNFSVVGMHTSIILEKVGSGDITRNDAHQALYYGISDREDTRANILGEISALYQKIADLKDRAEFLQIEADAMKPLCVALREAINQEDNHA